MDPAQTRFARRAVRRKGLFLVLSLAGIAVALLLAVYYGYRGWRDPAYPLGVRAVLILLILLNSRQNLRQYRYAQVLERLLE